MLGPWSAWSRGEGWGLLQSLPPYDEASAHGPAGSRLRDGRVRRRPGRRGADPVAAARPKAVGKFGEFAGGMIFTADGLEQATRLEVAAQHAQRFRAAGVRARVRPRLRHRRRRDGARRARPAGQGRRRRRGDRRGRRGQPAALAGRDHGGRARRGPAPAQRRGRPAHRRVAGPGPPTPGVADARGRTRRVFSLEAISPSWTTVQAHRPRPAGHRRQAQPVLPARRGAARRRGAVDVVRR